MKEKKLTFFKTERGIALIYADFYLMGFLFHIIPATRPLMDLLTPWVLTAGGLILLFLLRRGVERRFYLIFPAVYVITFLLEHIGVTTGLVFGPYGYGPTLGLALLGVPLVIGFNWALIVFGLYNGLERAFPRFRAAAPLLTGAGAVLFDYIMEPVAIHLDYWTWEGGVIPPRNYAAWFLIAFLCAWLFRLFKVTARSLLPLFYVGIQFLFFILIRIFLLRGV